MAEDEDIGVLRHALLASINKQPGDNDDKKDEDEDDLESLRAAALMSKKSRQNGTPPPQSQQPNSLTPHTQPIEPRPFVASYPRGPPRQFNRGGHFLQRNKRAVGTFNSPFPSTSSSSRSNLITIQTVSMEGEGSKESSPAPQRVKNPASSNPKQAAPLLLRPQDKWVLSVNESSCSSTPGSPKEKKKSSRFRRFDSSDSESDEDSGTSEKEEESDAESIVVYHHSDEEDNKSDRDHSDSEENKSVRSEKSTKEEDSEKSATVDEGLDKADNQCDEVSTINDTEVKDNNDKSPSPPVSRSSSPAGSVSSVKSTSSSSSSSSSSSESSASSHSSAKSVGNKSPAKSKESTPAKSRSPSPNHKSSLPKSQRSPDRPKSPCPAKSSSPLPQKSQSEVLNRSPPQRKSPPQNRSRSPDSIWEKPPSRGDAKSRSHSPRQQRSAVPNRQGSPRREGYRKRSNSRSPVPNRQRSLGKEGYRKRSNSPKVRSPVSNRQLPLGREGYRKRSNSPKVRSPVSNRQRSPGREGYRKRSNSPKVLSPTRQYNDWYRDEEKKHSHTRSQDDITSAWNQYLKEREERDARYRRMDVRDKYPQDTHDRGYRDSRSDDLREKDPGYYHDYRDSREGRDAAYHNDYRTLRDDRGHERREYPFERRRNSREPIDPDGRRDSREREWREWDIRIRDPRDTRYPEYPRDEQARVDRDYYVRDHERYSYDDKRDSYRNSNDPLNIRGPDYSSNERDSRYNQDNLDRREPYPSRDPREQVDVRQPPISRNRDPEIPQDLHRRINSREQDFSDRRQDGIDYIDDVRKSREEREPGRDVYEDSHSSRVPPIGHDSRYGDLRSGYAKDERRSRNCPDSKSGKDEHRSPGDRTLKTEQRGVPVHERKYREDKSHRETESKSSRNVPDENKRDKKGGDLPENNSKGDIWVKPPERRQKRDQIPKSQPSSKRQNGGDHKDKENKDQPHKERERDSLLRNKSEMRYNSSRNIKNESSSRNEKSNSSTRKSDDRKHFSSQGKKQHETGVEKSSSKKKISPVTEAKISVKDKTSSTKCEDNKPKASEQHNSESNDSSSDSENSKSDSNVLDSLLDDSDDSESDTRRSKATSERNRDDIERERRKMRILAQEKECEERLKKREKERRARQKEERSKIKDPSQERGRPRDRNQPRLSPAKEGQSSKKKNSPIRPLMSIVQPSKSNHESRSRSKESKRDSNVKSVGVSKRAEISSPKRKKLSQEKDDHDDAAGDARQVIIHRQRGKTSDSDKRNASPVKESKKKKKQNMEVKSPTIKITFNQDPGLKEIEKRSMSKNRLPIHKRLGLQLQDDEQSEVPSKPKKRKHSKGKRDKSPVTGKTCAVVEELPKKYSSGISGDKPKKIDLRSIIRPKNETVSAIEIKSKDLEIKSKDLPEKRKQNEPVSEGTPGKKKIRLNRPGRSGLETNRSDPKQEKALDQKILAIQAMNAEIERRKKQVEKDKKMFS